MLSGREMSGTLKPPPPSGQCGHCRPHLALETGRSGIGEPSPCALQVTSVDLLANSLENAQEGCGLSTSVLRIAPLGLALLGAWGWLTARLLAGKEPSMCSAPLARRYRQRG